ncbi:hypothetical protein QL285_006160 [Trifolium repens]|nr:hypothetical protein QL285_005881 [Trifolium repens]KAK2459085.1 hypothetical protein QL285_006160 [Trifolium repens]
MDNGGDANDVEMNGGNDMHNEKGEEELDVNRRATETLEDWLKAKATRLMNHRPVIQEAEQRWCKPRPGTLKCNVDVACYAASNQFCIGACLRDADGRVMKVYMKCLVSLL